MTRQPECDRCGQPVADLAYVCARCGEALRRGLLRLAAYAGEMLVDVAKQARHRALVAAGRPEPPLPYNPDAAARAWSVGNVVTTWAVHVSDHRGAPTPPAARPQAGPLCRAGYGCRHGSCDAIRTRAVEHPIGRAARWLAGHVDWLRHRPEAQEAFDELLDATEVARRTIDSPSDRWYAGPCGAELADGTKCTADLYARHGADVVRCADCGGEHDAVGRQAWLLDVAQDTLGHAALLAAAASALGRRCTAEQIRGLAHRARLLPHGRDLWNRPTYRLGDVLELLDQLEHTAVTTRRDSRTGVA